MWRLFLSRNIETQRPRPGTTSWFRVQAEAALWEEVEPLPALPLLERMLPPSRRRSPRRRRSMPLMVAWTCSAALPVVEITKHIITMNAYTSCLPPSLVLGAACSMLFQATGSS